MTTKRKIKVAQFGLGPIGKNCLQLLSEKSWVSVVGGVDIHPAWNGSQVSEVCQIPGLNAGKVYDCFENLWMEVQPDVVLHTAGSRAAVTFEQCRPMLECGVAVISSCEELLFPSFRAPELTREIDLLCQKSGGRILGTGVNPGFVLDLLPLCLTGVCRTVSGVYGERVVNASLRREPLQRKIGSGLPVDEFRSLWDAGKAGHAGFKESAHLLGHALGWTLGEITESFDPIVAEKDIQTDYFEVKAGLTCGLHQVVKATSTEGFPIHLDLKMYLDAPNPHDMIRLKSDPPMEATIQGGVSGDRATVAALVNCIPRLLASPPGVRLMSEIPLAAPEAFFSQEVVM